MSLKTAVPASVVIRTVCIVPAVSFVMFLVVRIQVVECETIVAGEEVNAGIISGIISTVFGEKSAVHIAGSGNAPCGGPGGPAVAF